MLRSLQHRAAAMGIHSSSCSCPRDYLHALVQTFGMMRTWVGTTSPMQPWTQIKSLSMSALRTSVENHGWPAGLSG